MKRFERILAGQSDAVAAPGAICALAFHLREVALRSGVTCVSLLSSRIKCSDSKILTLSDREGRQWRIRVSNHHLPRRTGHPEPHLDFVSFDGISGLDRASAYLSRIAGDEIAWMKPRLRPRRKGVR